MVVNYFLNTKYLTSNFSIPNAVVDDYIRSADGNQLKILLIILRNTSVVPTLEQLSLMSGLSMETVKDALKFWSDNNIICIVNGLSKQMNIKDYKPEILQPSVIMQMSEDSKDIKDLINIAQNIAGNKRLTPYEMSSLISAYNYLGMPKDVILALYSDCRLNNMNTLYFDSVISKWASMGVKTLDDANKYLHTEEYMRNVAKIFKFKYLLPNQRDLVMLWNSSNYPLEIVQYIYDKLSSTHTDKQSEKANIPYINKIISNWISQGIDTIEKVKEFEKSNKLYEFQNSGNTTNKAKTSTSYDLEEYKDFIRTTKRNMGG